MLETGDIIEARSKLDALLNEMADKSAGLRLSVDENVAGDKNDIWVSTPSKRNNISRTPRRKKKKDSFDEDYSINDSNQTSYVVKIFDRHVDLAKFNENTPLYVMMRAWMKNNIDVSNEKHQIENKSQQMTDPDMKDDNDENIYELPSAEEESPPYPKPVSPPIKTTLVENMIDSEEDIDKLRRENMLRWRKEKNRWREHSLRTQQCNLQSLLILKKAFTPHVT